MLKKKCVELERESILHVTRRSLVSKKNDEIFYLKLEDVEQSDKELDEIIEEKWDEARQIDKEWDAESVKNVVDNFDDVVDVMLKNVVADLHKENHEPRAANSRNYSCNKENNEVKRTDSGNPSAGNITIGSNANLMVHNVDVDFEIENNKVLGHEFATASFDENNYVFGRNSGSGIDDDDENDAGSGIGTSEVPKITFFQSSIVDTVRTRGDRVKKKKLTSFVTPPSSTPKRKRRSKKQVCRSMENSV
ncbi:uncharacterized protein [Primulina huaijiensis]|uniref:uncharacterized protein n=1 Tax=Primulina huaijiensis TaxID=1492673 RepID=UPI003CC7531C